MYYRVKRFQQSYKNMFVIDSDPDLEQLKSRTQIDDCAQRGPKPFANPEFVLSQDIICVSLGGNTKKTDIIKE